MADSIKMHQYHMRNYRYGNNGECDSTTQIYAKVVEKKVSADMKALKEKLATNDSPSTGNKSRHG